MHTFSTMKVGTKLTLGFGSLVAIMLSLAAFTLLHIYRIDTVVQTQNKLRTEKLEQLYLAREALDQTGMAARNAYIFPDDRDANRELDILDRQKEIYLEALAALTPVFKGDANFEKVRKGLLSMAEELNRPRKYRSAGKMQDYGLFLVNDCSPLRRQIVADIDVVLKAVQGAVNTESRTAADEVSRTATILLSVTGFAVLLSIVVGTVITRALLKQIGGEPAAVAAIAQNVAQGNLAIDVVTKDGDRSSIMYAMKEMRDSLVRIVAQVRTGTETIATASAEIASGNMDLSSRTEQQASSLEETASSMEELTSAVKQNVDNARQGNEFAEAASTVAVKGGEVMSQVVGTMGAINQSAQKIADIIGVIDGIAFQTNILALNAAVEAARAGEQGRGFAVVASEVRALAQRSSAAAKEIKSLIGDSVNKIGAGSILVSDAGATMEEIVNRVKRVNSIMGEILIASQEQSAGIEQVNQAIAQMDQVTQQNAALVEEAAAAAGSLQEQAGHLAQTVSTFNLGQTISTSGIATSIPATKSLSGQRRVAVRPTIGSKPYPRQIAQRTEPSSGDWDSF